jgi:hypothetical protein
MEIKKEFVIWGIDPNNDFESVLYTKATDLEQAERVIWLLENSHGCKNCRIQVIDFNNDFNNDFINAINK